MRASVQPHPVVASRLSSAPRAREASGGEAEPGGEHDQEGEGGHGEGSASTECGMLPADQAWMRAPQAAIVPSTAREGVRRKRHEYTIFEKRQVGRFALSLPRSASKLRLVGLKFPQMSGIAENGLVGKWTRRYHDFQWEHVPDELAKLAKHCDGSMISNGNMSLGLGDGKKMTLKGRPGDRTMPEEVRRELEQQVRGDRRVRKCFE